MEEAAASSDAEDTAELAGASLTAEDAAELAGASFAAEEEDPHPASSPRLMAAVSAIAINFFITYISFFCFMLPLYRGTVVL